MTEEELQEYRRKYMRKLVRILLDGEPVPSRNIGIVTDVSPGYRGFPQLTLALPGAGQEMWYINHNGYTAEVYTH